MQEEWDDVFVTLQLAYKEHGNQNALKTAARLIRNRVKNEECYTFLNKLQRSPAPMKVLLNEIATRRPENILNE